MLSINQDLFENDIESVAMFEEKHPVYLLSGGGQTCLVVKFESGAVTRDQLRSNALVMGTIDQSARQVPLTKNEVQELYNWAVRRSDEDIDDDEMKVVRSIRVIQGEPGKWTKSVFLDVVGLKRAMDDRLGGDKSRVRLFAAALNATGGLEQLGRIVAADFFNGNRDRFTYNAKRNSPKQTKDCGDLLGDQTRLHHLINIGNVMLVAEGQTIRPVGLDSFDPHSPFKKWDAALDEQELDGLWAGRLLARSRKDDRAEFARRVIEDLECILGPRKRHKLIRYIARKRRLVRDAATRFRKGMEDGTKEIVVELTRKYPEGNRPVGLSDRLEILEH